MKGIIVFLVAFFAMLAATLAYPDMPPGRQIYDAFGLPATIDYLVLGINAATLIKAVFNGVFFGVIAWVAYMIAEKARKGN